MERIAGDIIRHRRIRHLVFTSPRRHVTSKNRFQAVRKRRPPPSSTANSNTLARVLPSLKTLWERKHYRVLQLLVAKPIPHFLFSFLMRGINVYFAGSYNRAYAREIFTVCSSIPSTIFFFLFFPSLSLSLPLSVSLFGDRFILCDRMQLKCLMKVSLYFRLPYELTGCYESQHRRLFNWRFSNTNFYSCNFSGATFLRVVLYFLFFFLFFFIYMWLKNEMRILLLSL